MAFLFLCLENGPRTSRSSGELGGSGANSAVWENIGKCLVSRRLKSCSLAAIPTWILVLGVPWHLRFKLSDWDLVSRMRERGINLGHSAILRWVRHYTPQFEQRSKRYPCPVGDSWRMDVPTRHVAQPTC